MSYGGFHPYPRRYGGGRPLLEVQVESLARQRGTALDATNPDSIAWLECMAIARALVFDGWYTNQRLAYQWDPRKMTDMLPRWERILKLRPGPDATDSERRAEVLKHFERFVGLTNHAKLLTELEAALGPVFVGIEYISTSNAIVTVPDGSYPWGSVVPGYPWSSSIAHILVRLQKPDGYTEGDFYDAAAKVVPIFDAIMPADKTVDWYRAPTGGAPINVVGGPSAAGFYLDQEANLDNHVFDV